MRQNFNSELYNLPTLNRCLNTMGDCFFRYLHEITFAIIPAPCRNYSVPSFKSLYNTQINKTTDTITEISLIHRISDVQLL